MRMSCIKQMGPPSNVLSLQDVSIDFWTGASIAPTGLRNANQLHCARFWFDWNIKCRSSNMSNVHWCYCFDFSCYIIEKLGETPPLYLNSVFTLVAVELSCRVQRKKDEWDNLIRHNVRMKKFFCHRKELVVGPILNAVKRNVPIIQLSEQMSSN